MQRPCSFHSRHAASAVEFAVVSLVFFTFVLAAVELGRARMVSHLLVSAARQSCRVGAVQGRTSADISASASDALKNASLPSATVTVLVNGSPGEAGNAASGDLITVEVSLPSSSVAWVPNPRFLPATLRGSYSLRRD